MSQIESTSRHWLLAPSPINLVHTIPSYFCKAHFNTALLSTSRSSWWYLCVSYDYNIFLHIAHFSRASNILYPRHLPTLYNQSSAAVLTTCAWECSFPSVSQRPCHRAICVWGPCKRCLLVASSGHFSDNSSVSVASQALYGQSITCVPRSLFM